MSKDEDYVPYGKEWKAHLMKWRKTDLIDLLKKAFEEVGELKQELKNRDNVSRS